MSDLIKREDAITAINELSKEPNFYHADNDYWICGVIEARDAVENVPSADKPQNVIAQITFDEEKLREIVKEAVERFKEEYEITDIPQGEWIDKGWKGDWQFETDGRGNCWYEYECSECGFRNIGNKSNFCPNCGARMKGADDE